MGSLLLKRSKSFSKISKEQLLLAVESGCKLVACFCLVARDSCPHILAVKKIYVNW